MTKTWYKIDDGTPAVFDDSENISDWPDFQETLPSAFLEQSVRSVRDNLLAVTDIWALSDRTMTAEQIAYRQDLRDLSDQAGFPTSITWPIKP